MIGPSRRALLRRIDDELALQAAIPDLAGPRAARAVVALEGAKDGPIGDRLRPSEVGGVGDRRLHAIASLECARFARAVAASDESALEASARALIRTWAALGGRRGYLEAIAGPVVGTQVAGDLAARIGVERVVAALHDRARRGGDLGALMRALGSAPALGPELGRIAARARLEALDVVLESSRRALDELATRRPSIDELVAAFAALRGAWRRCDRDVEVEVLAVERLADFAWDLYRERSLVDLGRLVDEVTEPATSLAARIERGEPAIAWAAPCAQVLVFRAELAPRFDVQVTLAERAYAVCPTLRNARLVLGDFLLTRAERALDKGASTTTGGTTPEQDVARAALVHPDLRRLPAVREKLGKRRSA